MVSHRIVALVLLVLALAACATPGVQPAPPEAPATEADAGARGAMDARLGDVARALRGVRPAFQACVQAAGRRAGPLRACVDAEFQHQQARLDAALAARRGASRSNGDFDAIQAQWASERERLCGADGPGASSARNVESAMCRLELTVARADALSR